ncbi:YybH family protein [Pandoraea apista]|uniref:YybH family protein n=1 Tax=Pandoraea apista TaxID=93218 RepID=UPI00248F0251|nr:nuclear transport factor 2 family protein [Pandoraea apista]
MSKESVVKHLTQRYEDWMSAIVSKDIDVIESLYADDAVYMPPGRARCVGKAAVVANWKMYFERADFQARYTPQLDVSASEDVAYDIGTYRLTLTRAGEPVEVVGKYVVVWKKLAGEWRVSVDIDNTDA